MQSVTVKPNSSSYEVRIGDGAARMFDELVPSSTDRVVILTQEQIPHDLPTEREVVKINVPAGEAAKSLATVESVASQMAQHGFTRRDLVVGFGGGAVTDLAGFVAATYHRGVRVVHVPTTLLAQVDAAIGGKCGVNLAEGKNLVGAFKQPEAVICDTSVLATLPEREWTCGYGEVVKYRFLRDADWDALDLEELIATCVDIKAKVVEADERESMAATRGRVLLNYGHTLAHAVEAATDYGTSHGEAVSIGLVFAARLANRLGRITPERVEDHLIAVRHYGLPDSINERLGAAELMELMMHDKKAFDGMTFVLDGPTGLELVHDVDQVLVSEVLRDSGAGI